MRKKRRIVNSDVLEETAAELFHF